MKERQRHLCRVGDLSGARCAGTKGGLDALHDLEGDHAGHDDRVPVLVDHGRPLDVEALYRRRDRLHTPSKDRVPMQPCITCPSEVDDHKNKNGNGNGIISFPIS